LHVGVLIHFEFQRDQIVGHAVSPLPWRTRSASDRAAMHMPRWINAGTARTAAERTACASAPELSAQSVRTRTSLSGMQSENRKPGRREVLVIVPRPASESVAAAPALEPARPSRTKKLPAFSTSCDPPKSLKAMTHRKNVAPTPTCNTARSQTQCTLAATCYGFGLSRLGSCWPSPRSS
jgi:hypothetical protein